MKHLQKPISKLFFSSLRSKLPKSFAGLLTSFSKKNSKQAVTQLKQVLFTQLKMQEKSKYDTKKFQQLLESIGWTITKTGAKLQLTKQTQTHNFHAFMTIKPPIALNSQIKQGFIDTKQLEIEAIEEQLQNKRNPQLKKQLQALKSFLNSQPFQQNMVQVAVFVSKLNQSTPKYACLQFITNSQFAHLQDISIWPKIVPSRIDRFREIQLFTGRGITQLELEVTSLLAMEVEESWELRKQVLETMFHLNIAYEQEQYIQWLKNFDQIL